jgi:hypothetical protein
MAAQGDASVANNSEGEGVREVRHVLEQLREEGRRKCLTIGGRF